MKDWLTDWPKLLSEIQESGIKPFRLAWHLKVDKKTLQSYAEGRTEPRHSVGELIKQIHSEATEKFPS